jgi:hypothetical protein
MQGADWLIRPPSAAQLLLPSLASVLRHVTPRDLVTYVIQYGRFSATYQRVVYAQVGYTDFLDKMAPSISIYHMLAKTK